MPGSPSSSSAPTLQGVPFACRCSVADGVAFLAVTGELDITALPEFDRALHLVECEARVVVLDLRDVEFVSSSGGDAMVAADRRVRKAGGRFMVIRGPEEVDWFFRLAGFDSALELVDDPRSLRSARDGRNPLPQSRTTRLPSPIQRPPTSGPPSPLLPGGPLVSGHQTGP